MADDNTAGASEPYVGQIVGYHPAHDEGLGHAIRPAMVTALARSGDRLAVTLSVFLDDGRVVARVHPIAGAQSDGFAGYWDFLRP
jgi:hypothetical protein